MDNVLFAEELIGVITIEVGLYVVLIERWKRIFEKCLRCLTVGEKLLLRGTDRLVTQNRFVVNLQETLATKVVRRSLGIPPEQAVRNAWHFLLALDPFWRFHQAIRMLLVPFQSVLSHLPEKGTLLDLGCGNGLFLALANEAKPSLDLVGVELSREKIIAGRKAFLASVPCVPQLTVTDIADFPEQSVDVITIIDVLYLIPLEHWKCILEKCFRCLKPDGKVLLKEMDRSVGWKFILLYVEESLAVKVLGLTLGSQFTFPERQAISLQLSDVGFQVEDMAIDRGYFAPHHLWVGRRISHA
jgi:2-polyprenyl-3-methyl-5-hydroxy-6-metoxy-1,4-benzoquinol methylase